MAKKLKKYKEKGKTKKFDVFEYTGDIQSLRDFTGLKTCDKAGSEDRIILYGTEDGDIMLKVGDHITRDSKKKCLPNRHWIFNEKYEEV